LYMGPQNLGTACVVSQSKTISVFLAEGFSCKCPLGERESYISYSQKLLGPTFSCVHKPTELHSTAWVWNPLGISNS
jgi:hypothetical protein